MFIRTPAVSWSAHVRAMSSAFCAAVSTSSRCASVTVSRVYYCICSKMYAILDKAAAICEILNIWMTDRQISVKSGWLDSLRCLLYWRKDFSLSLLSINVHCGFCIHGFYYVELVSPIFSLLCVFIMKWCWLNHVKLLFCINWDDEVFSFLHSANVGHYTDGYLYVEPSLHSRNKSYLVMVHNSCDVLLTDLLVFCWEFLHHCSSPWWY
jgi:hypothetical protein